MAKFWDTTSYDGLSNVASPWAPGLGGAHLSMLTSLFSVSYTNYNPPGASLSHFSLWLSISASSLPSP